VPQGTTRNIRKTPENLKIAALIWKPTNGCHDFIGKYSFKKTGRVKTLLLELNFIIGEL